MKRATPIPFVLLVVLALAALFVKVPASTVPTGDAINSGDVAWMLTASALVLLMTPGLSFFYGGMVGFKNVVSTMLQSVVALGVISLVWVLVGFSLAFGDDVGHVRRQPADVLHVRRRGRGDPPEAGADDPAAGLRDVPAQVRDHHAGPDHGVVRRAGAVLVLPAVHGPVQPVHLLPAGALDLASRRVPATSGA